jgi:plastocyanin
MAPPQGTGAVHTIMVAPMQGTLRYFPVAVNATVGDTIRYVWTTPANHTATLSSAFAICNKSVEAEKLNWVSGVRNASAGTQTCAYLPSPLALTTDHWLTRTFTVDVTIQTNEQQFFYCSVAQHCAKGMFGIVQPKMGGNNTVSFHMNKWLESVRVLLLLSSPYFSRSLISRAHVGPRSQSRLERRTRADQGHLG